MSESERALGLRRFDARLDAYLRRNLPEDHDRISSSVKCVASLTGDIQNKHRYAILGHKCVYFADVPPKNLRVAVQFRDVHSVEMLNDLPAFLKPKDSENTVHVQVQYRKKTKEKSDILSTITKRSPSLFRKQKETPSITNFEPQSPPSSSPQTYPLSPNLPPRTYPSTRSKSLSPRSPLVHTTKSPPIGRPLPSLNGSPAPKRIAEDTRVSSSLSTNESDDLRTSSVSTLSPIPNVLTAKQRSQSTNTLLRLDSPSVRQRSSSSNDLYGSSLKDSKRHSSLLSIADTIGLDTESQSTAGDKTELGVMDLYILQPVSDFYHQMCVAWDNWNIQRMCSGAEAQQPAKSPLLQRDFSQKYTSLKQELLHSIQNLEKAAELALELCTAAQKYSTIKRLFWEDSELLEFCVTQLGAYLNLTRALKHSAADRIEYSIILMDMLYQMLRETHHIKKKMVVLTRNSGHSLLSLSTVIVNNMPKTSTELATFERELTEKSCGVLYELLQVCLQTKWPEADKSSLVVTKIAEDVIKSPGMMDFLGHMVTYIRRVIGLNSDPISEVEASNQVSLYHISFVLNVLVKNCSSSALRLLRARLVEDFRYYISITRTKQVLPECNPLSRKTVSFLQHVKSKIV